MSKKLFKNINVILTTLWRKKAEYNILNHAFEIFCTTFITEHTVVVDNINRVIILKIILSSFFETEC